MDDVWWTWRKGDRHETTTDLQPGRRGPGDPRFGRRREDRGPATWHPHRSRQSRSAVVAAVRDGDRAVSRCGRRRSPPDTCSSRAASAARWKGRWAFTSRTGRCSTATIDVRNPEVLVYEPKNGRLQLVAAEYIVPAEFWDPTHDESDKPHLMGQLYPLRAQPQSLRRRAVLRAARVGDEAEPARRVRRLEPQRVLCRLGHAVGPATRQGWRAGSPWDRPPSR